jgi:two-component system phosphate regulon sensor histidine kinase PhoR
MSQSLLNFLRSRIWTLTFALALAGAAVLLLGPRALWGLIAFSLAAALIIRFIAPPAVAPRPVEPRPEGAVAMLPTLTRLLLEQLPMPVMLLDASQRVLFVNEPMRALLGGGALRSPVSALFRNPAVLEAIDHTVKTGEPGNMPFTLPVPIERHFQAYTAAISTAPPATLLLLHDLTAIRRSEQMRADFVANASHELRTPLAAVSGFIDTLRGHARNDEAARDQFLDIMSVEAARMRRLIDDLLSLTRIELNEHVPPHGRIALEHVVREAVAALAPLAEAGRIVVTLSAGANLPPVNGDRDELVQLFQNLIHNAIKYGRDNGHVWVTLGASANAEGEPLVFASVRDDGDGIPQSAIPRLTERFYRVDVKRSREKGGTGLGLAIVKHIVSRHKGRLIIESPPGEGATFTVLLPAIATETGQKPALTPVVTELL